MATARGSDDAPPPFAPWPEFARRFRWLPGEHVALVGPTGRGKTTLGLGLMELRHWTMVLATKPADATLAGLKRDGYERIKAWPPPRWPTPRVLLWPKFAGESSMPAQRAAIAHALDESFRSKRWTIFADDLQYLTDDLRLARKFSMLWRMARSNDVTIVAATQRPRQVPRVMWNQSTHLFIWQTADEEDLRSIGGLGGLSSKRIRELVANLAPHHALYVNTRDDRLAITQAERR